jgi:uncharacterized protein (DUF2141 family)
MSVSRFACTTLAMLAFSPLWSNAAPTDAIVRVEIASLRNAQGDVGCLIFNSPDGYPETHAKAYKEMHTAIEGDHAVCEFKDVTPGTYAVIVFHDENQNGKLDKNFLGVPQEGYAASNNVRHLMSAPEFKESSFVVSAAVVTPIKVHVRY